MQFEKTKTYEIRPIGKVTHIPLSKFIKTRERYGCDTDAHKKCFMCEAPLDIEQEHNVIAITGIGNSFVCDTCYEPILQNKTEEQDVND